MIKKFIALVAICIGLTSPALAWRKGSTGWTPNSTTLWSAQSLWNSVPVNPVLGGTLIPLKAGSTDINGIYPGQGDIVSINNSGQSSGTVSMAYITDEAQQRILSYLYFPTDTAANISPGSDHLWDFIDVTTNNLMSFIGVAAPISGACPNGYPGVGTWCAVNFESYPIAGTGMPSPSRPTGPRAAASPSFSGYLRAWEENLPIVNHALSIVVDQTTLQGNASALGPIFPMTSTDGTHTGYTGKNFRMGSLLMLPSNFPINSLVLPQAQAVARTLMKYGGYLVDTTGAGTGGMGINYEGNSTWAGMCNTNPCNDLVTIRNALREVMTQDGWLDANSNSFTPTPWSQMNLLSMRGTWLALGGGALPTNGGLPTAYFSTVSGNYEFPDTSVTPGAPFTIQTYRNFRNYSALASWQNWTPSTQYFYVNPVPGRSYTLTATGTGSGASAYIIVYSGTGYSGALFTSSTLNPGQSQTFTWPATWTSAGSMGMFVTKTAGAAASVGLQLTPAAPQAYYVSNSGSDSNNGMTPATAWQTIAHVNAQTFIPGDTIYLDSCSPSFTDELIPPSAGYLSLPITFTSYNTCGRATIAPSAAVPGIAITNLPFVAVNNINVVGLSKTTDVSHGVIVQNNQAGNTKLEGIVLSNMTVSLFGLDCVLINGTNGSSGTNRLVVHDVITHDCAGAAPVGNVGTTGGLIVAGANYGGGVTTPSHTNMTIDHVTSYNNPGVSGQSSWSGAGIFIGQSSSAVVEYATVYNNGAGGTGACGIWMSDGTANSIIYSTVYGQGSTSTNGCGIDIDGGITLSYAWGNYTHGNFGPGLLAYAYNDGTVTTWNGNHFAYNVSENDGTGYATNALNAGGLSVQVASGTMTNLFAYNNSIFNNGVSSSVVNIVGTPTGSYMLDNILDAGASSITLLNTNAAYTAAQVEFQYNDYWTTGTFSIDWNGTTYSTLNAWITATSFTQEWNGSAVVGKNVNPNFLNPGTVTLAGFKLEASPLVAGAGLYPNQFQFGNHAIVPPLLTDPFGNYTNYASWPIGAYSGTGVP